MKIEKLELKHICGYLPWGLTGCHKEGHICNIDFDMVVKYGTNLANYKPLLLPLSALTEPLEDGTVPIVELAKIADSDVNVIECKFSNAIYGVKYLDEVGVECVFAFNSNFNSFGLHEVVTEEFHVVPYQDKLFEYLYSKHFDIFDLIGNNLAIDKRTVKL